MTLTLCIHHHRNSTERGKHWGASKPAPEQNLVCTLQNKIRCRMVPKCIHFLTEVLLILTWHLPRISSIPLLQHTRRLIREKDTDETQDYTQHFKLIQPKPAAQRGSSTHFHPPWQLISLSILADGKTQLTWKGILRINIQLQSVVSKTCISYLPSTVATLRTGLRLFYVVISEM